jgi:phosphinothricin acetyltransferase
MSSYLIRPAVKADAQIINDILNYYVERSTATFITEPQPLEQRLLWLEEHSGNHPAVVVESNGEVIGWGALSSFRTRAAYAHTAEVSVYVRHDFHRRGVGRAMLTDLIARAKSLGHHVLIGGCCNESAASISLLESFGFSRVGTFHDVGRKFDRWLDVIFFELVLRET